MQLDIYDRLHIDVVLKDLKMTVLVSLNREIVWAWTNKQTTNYRTLTALARRE